MCMYVFSNHCSGRLHCFPCVIANTATNIVHNIRHNPKRYQGHNDMFMADMIAPNQPISVAIQYLGAEEVDIGLTFILSPRIK